MMTPGCIEISQSFIATLSELSASQCVAAPWQIETENTYPAGVEDVS